MSLSFIIATIVEVNLEVSTHNTHISIYFSHVLRTDSIAIVYLDYKYNLFYVSLPMQDYQCVVLLN